MGETPVDWADPDHVFTLENGPELVLIPDLIAPTTTAPDRARMRSAITGTMRTERFKDLNICKVE